MSISFLEVTCFLSLTNSFHIIKCKYWIRAKMDNKMKKKEKKKQHCQNSSKIKYQNRRKKQNRYSVLAYKYTTAHFPALVQAFHTNTRPLTSLPWYRHFIQIHDRSLPCLGTGLSIKVLMKNNNPNSKYRKQTICKDI